MFRNFLSAKTLNSAEYYLLINKNLSCNLVKHSRLLCVHNKCIKNKNYAKSFTFSIDNKNLNHVRNLCSSKLPKHITVKLPALSPTMEVGTIVSWEKKEGDRLSEGDLLAEIETDKATMGFETPEEGFLAKIILPAGEKNIPLGKILCIIVENESDIEYFKDYVSNTSNEQENKPDKEIKTTVVPEPVQLKTQNKQETTSIAQKNPTLSFINQRVFISPLAKSLALKEGIDITNLVPSGPNKRIRAIDVKKGKISKVDTNVLQDIDLSSIRQAIVKNLCLSKQNIPHYYLTVEIEVDELLNIKSQMNDMLLKENIKLSINDFIIKASALACKQVPEANSSWQETFIRQYENVDISLAINTDSGLITPIVFNANELGLKDISTQVKLLANKARDGTLKPNEYQGGTFTINNLGMFNINKFSAIINPPQSCILAVGSIEQKVVINKDPQNDNDKFKITNVLNVTLSCDHRVVDGAVGAKWLQQFSQYLKNPFTMVL